MSWLMSIGVDLLANQGSPFADLGPEGNPDGIASMTSAFELFLERPRQFTEVRRNSVRFVRFILHPRLVRNPVHLSSPASNIRERLFEGGAFVAMFV